MRYALQFVSLIGVLLLALGGKAHGQTILCDGVLGNSGQAGGTLVRFGAQRHGRDAGGMGVAFDRLGSLWDRGGNGTLNRYALDGRLIASYKMPAAQANTDHLTLVGDTLVLLVREKLYTLDIKQPASEPLKDMKRTLRLLSRNTKAGRLAAIDETGQLLWLDPVSGDSEVNIALTIEKPRYLDVGPDGAVYVFADNMMHKVDAGVINPEGWPRRIHGNRESSPDRMAWVDGAWFGHGWHSTVKRYAADFSPDPGVVLGGGSGYVIGHVPSNDELSFGQGMARVSDGLYAISGIGGVMHLMRWNESTQKMKLVRRIGALVDVPGLAIDPQGRISTGQGLWNWSDGPDTPLDEASGPEPLGQMAMLDSGQLATPAGRYNRSRPTWLSGAITDNRRSDDRDDFLFGKVVPSGAVAYRVGNQWRVLLMSPAGEARIVQVGSDGRAGKVFDAFKLDPGVPVKRWTTLAVLDGERFLAAGDGAIHRFRWQGDAAVSDGQWKPQLPEGQALGDSVTITADAGRMWIADTTRHRVLCCNLADGTVLGQFGRTDSAGEDLAHVSSPTTLAARAGRAVVFDSGNQRLLKLTLP